jgi:hypothetical protein
MAQVFVSYSRQDLGFVEQLASDLKTAGFDVWYDMSGISGGAGWKVAIEKALRESEFVVVVLSPVIRCKIVCGEAVSHTTFPARRIACRLSGR